jgi:RHS repeat-associated protein
MKEARMKNSYRLTVQKLAGCAVLLALCLLPRTSFADRSVLYLYNDAQGTPVVAADHSGNLVWRRVYEPYGREHSVTGDRVSSALTARGYTGHVKDSHSGLIYMGARAYHPTLGLFLSPDPAAVEPTIPETFNRYAYANNNPYGFVDPDGRRPVTAAEQAKPYVKTAVDFMKPDEVDIALAAAGGAASLADGPLPVADVSAAAVVGGRYVVVRALRLAKDGYRWAKKRWTRVCFVAGTPVLLSGHLQPIESIRVGDRVWSHQGGHSVSTDEAWTGASFSLLEHAGQSRVELEVLRPASWFEENGLFASGDEVFVDLPELDIKGWATLEDTWAHAQRDSEPGRLVLTTINRLSNDVYEVSFGEGGEPLRGTGSHPLYSLDANDWVRIENLQVGERLQTAEGAVTVEALEKVRGVHRVYNLEVDGDHEYLVGEAGIRAHNKGGTRAARGGGGALDDVVRASTPVGRRGAPLTVPPGTNAPATIGGRNFTGHALDQMQSRGFTPTVVENAIQNGVRTAGNQPGTFQHVVEGVRVITNEAGGVITVIPR